MSIPDTTLSTAKTNPHYGGRCRAFVCHCKRTAAVAAVAAVGVVALAKWKTTCTVLLSSFLFLPCSHFFLPPVSPSVCSAGLWVSSTLSSSRACSAALLLARFVDGLAQSACVVRCQRGSTRRFSTKSCVYSTHHFLRALHSFPSLFQRGEVEHTDQRRMATCGRTENCEGGELRRRCEFGASLAQSQTGDAGEQTQLSKGT